HDGALYAGLWSYDWTRVNRDSLDFCRVYRYRGGREWWDCGQPGECKRLFSLASFQGRIYVLGDDYKCHVYVGGEEWRVCGVYQSHIHPMGVHDRKLYVGAFDAITVGGMRQAAVFSYDGKEWTNLGCPLGAAEPATQLHALEVYRGKLYVTTWPTGKVAVLEDDGRWVDCGRLGASTEINSLTVYNGKLYAGSIPRAEVYRYEGGTEWTRMARFFAPAGWEPVPAIGPGDRSDPKNTLAQWTRVTSLTVHRGKLFAGIGSCTSALADAPADVRGRVFAMQAGQCVSYDQDIGPGWKHVAAVRKRNQLELYVNGKPAVVSPTFQPEDYDLSNEE
ncbi:MAG: hypothetical protein Q8N51_11085, partial [Gammaproteobacteria bacterium]|nr:hypothetical protein [Gammaproteobacteria bacterium]